MTAARLILLNHSAGPTDGSGYQVANGDFTVEDSMLRHAPHTAAAVVNSDWNRSYSREQAVFPVHHLKQDKYFAPVGRIDAAGGDRNLICSCPPLSDFEN